MMLKQYIYTALLLLLCVESGCFLTRKTPTDYEDVVIVTEPETPPPPPVSEEKPTPPVIVAPPIGKKDTVKTEPQKPSDFIQQKSVYDIAYLLPFNITYNNLDSANDSIYSKSILALDFWQGTQMALEEIRDAVQNSILLCSTAKTPRSGDKFVQRRQFPATIRFNDRSRLYQTVECSGRFCPQT
ncbi:MAG: hypothetical protein IPL35_03050 [Sphingobacteriales bacterium]|nr:hypothetical protein [Sphingobacteriales bacterium]